MTGKQTKQPMHNITCLAELKRIRNCLPVPGGAVDVIAVDTHSGSPPYRKKALVAKSITFTDQSNSCESLFYFIFTMF